MTHILSICPALAFLWLSHAVFGQTTTSDSTGALTRRYMLTRGQPLRAPATPASLIEIATTETAHNQGNIQLSVSNTGRFGLPYSWDTFGQWMPVTDPLSNDPIQRCTYPANSNHVFLLDSWMWVAGLKEYDTVVCMWDWFPEFYGNQPFRYMSAERAQTGFYSPAARSDLDITCEYTDTMHEWNRHPTGLKVYQRSMAWGGQGSDDFVLVECTLENLDDKPLHDIYLAISFNNSVYHTSELIDPNREFNKFFTGYLPTYPRRNCASEDTLNLAYAMVADPRPAVKRWSIYSARAAVGMRFIQAPVPNMRPNFNWECYLPGYWWYSPRLRGTPEDPFRQYDEYGPYEPGEMYHYASHKETDYDQMYTAKDKGGDGWLPPPPDAEMVASGYPAMATLSLGDFSLAPGARGSFVFAIVGGDSVINDPMIYTRFDPNAPEWYYSRLDFSHLAANAAWASRVYDNPGFDTDHDGYAGEFEICEGDTVWVRGDGIADWRADGPPSPPEMRIIPSLSQLAIRWNGYLSETSIDPLTRTRDFEGYNVYFGLDERLSSMSLLTSFDHVNYIRYRLVGSADGTWDWKPTGNPLTVEQLRAEYLDPEFDPTLYGREHPLVINGEYFCFLPQSANIGFKGGVRKVYPDAVKPSDDSLQWADDEVTMEHGHRLPKYYEYEYVFDGILPTIQYYVAVTAFDFGFATSGITAQESRVAATLTPAWAIPSSAEVAENNLSVYVWPNPYRFDGDYELKGYENHDQSLYVDRVHRIHFGNLPPVCKISILSLDGDLVKEINHDFSPSDPNASHDAWDLITRNYQVAVSGIYYWVVESSSGTQTGKIIVIE